MDQEIVVHPHSVVPLSSKKELRYAARTVGHTAKGMNQDHYTECEMPGKKSIYPVRFHLCTILENAD